MWTSFPFGAELPAGWNSATAGESEGARGGAEGSTVLQTAGSSPTLPLHPAGQTFCTVQYIP